MTDAQDQPIPKSSRNRRYGKVSTVLWAVLILALAILNVFAIRDRQRVGIVLEEARGVQAIVAGNDTLRESVERFRVSIQMKSRLLKTFNEQADRVDLLMIPDRSEIAYRSASRQFGRNSLMFWLPEGNHQLRVRVYEMASEFGYTLPDNPNGEYVIPLSGGQVHRVEFELETTEVTTRQSIQFVEPTGTALHHLVQVTGKMAVDSHGVTSDSTRTGFSPPGLVTYNSIENEYAPGIRIADWSSGMTSAVNSTQIHVRTVVDIVSEGPLVFDSRRDLEVLQYLFRKRGMNLDEFVSPIEGSRYNALDREAFDRYMSTDDAPGSRQ